MAKIAPLRLLLPATIGCLIAGCAASNATLAAVSSGQIGCPESDIAITDRTHHYGLETWTAHCHGEDYFCSAVATGPGAAQLNCKAADQPSAQESTPPASSQASTPAAPPPGCSYDTQCKGDRICRNGSCVDP